MDNPASPADPRLAAYAGNGALLQVRLDESWRALQRELPALVSWITGGQVTAPDAGDVVISGVLRVLRNPDGAAEESSSLDDYSENTKRADATLDVYFTSAELRRLNPAEAIGANSGSFSFAGFYNHRAHGCWPC